MREAQTDTKQEVWMRRDGKGNDTSHDRERDHVLELSLVLLSIPAALGCSRSPWSRLSRPPIHSSPSHHIRDPSHRKPPYPRFSLQSRAPADGGIATALERTLCRYNAHICSIFDVKLLLSSQSPRTRVLKPSATSRRGQAKASITIPSYQLCNTLILVGLASSPLSVPLNSAPSSCPYPARIRALIRMLYSGHPPAAGLLECTCMSFIEM
jgi:hypothetical protein